MVRNYTYERKKSTIVFYISAILVSIFVLWGALGPASLERVSNRLLVATLKNFGWFYMLCTALIIVFVLFLAIGPYGKLRLGKQDDRPEFKLFTWLGMLFSAGVGVGFVFWGVAEPSLYYLDPHPDYVAAASDIRAAAGLRYAIFHWALHPWAMFSLIGLTLAYVQFRKDQPALISSAFHPLIGSRIHGPIGKIIDVLAIIATSTGIATTFGLSALQISGGLSYITSDKIPNNSMTYFIVIVIVTVLFLFSAASGVDKGMKILSNINIIVAAFLLVFMVIFGPTLFIAEGIVSTLGNYLTNIVRMSFDLKPFGNAEWLGRYTIFFWAWHISWAPYLGIFIARISRGRTIREFIAGVLIVPSLLALIWFTAFGGTTLKMILDGHEQLARLITENVEMALFVTLAELPLGFFMSVVSVFLIFIFFITSADSASYVLAALSSDGSLDPKLYLKVIWGFLIAGTASVLLLSGGLTGLQAGSIIAALPFTFILVIMIISLFIMLTRDLKAERIWSTRTSTRKMKKEVHEEMYDKIKNNVYDDMKDNVYNEVKDDMYEQMKGEVYEEFKEEMYDDLKEEVYEEFKEKIYDDLKDDITVQLERKDNERDQREKIKEKQLGTWENKKEKP